MPAWTRLKLAVRAVRQLGLLPVAQMALYRFGLLTGHYRRLTPTGDLSLPEDIQLNFPLTLPERSVYAALLGDAGADLLAEADEICAGHLRLFGGPPVPLELAPPDAQRHWTHFESSPAHGVDIKFTWEPARFGWAIVLARAYHLSTDEKYAEHFWRITETFWQGNPVNCGPNWANGQEVALRLCALTFAAQVIAASPASTPQRMARLAGSLAALAARIPVTLVYARAQNNNHRITEAVGLITAGLVLMQLPQATAWLKSGLSEFNQAIDSQIAADGTYTQHSLNYHRLMLQAALWTDALLRANQLALPEETRQRLAAAATWLIQQLDPISGAAPNLGHNDGALIFPLACASYADQRPTAQAAAYAFLNAPCLPPGTWDEPALWLGLLPNAPRPSAPIQVTPAPNRLVDADSTSWAQLRAAVYTARPGQSDQLHVDIWQHGAPLTLDSGTYRYSAPAPWENALARTLAHNTVSVDGAEQMTRASRFLWLDWAQAHFLPAYLPQSLTAEHSGYAQRGVLHRRTLALTQPAQWTVIEDLRPAAHTRRARSAHRYTLTWLLPDYPYEFTQNEAERSASLHLHTPHGPLNLTLQAEPPVQWLEALLGRAGERLAGTGDVQPYQGWYSPTYGVKIPALVLQLTVESPPPCQISSVFDLDP